MPEAEWLAYQQRLAETLERVDAINADLAERAEQRRADGTDIEARYAERQRQESDRAAPQQPEPVQRAPRAPVRDWAAEQKWIEGIIDRKLHAFAGIIGQAEGEATKEDRAAIRAEIEARIAKSDAATVELILGLERKVAELEQRAMMKPPPKPKLVDDNAA